MLGVCVAHCSGASEPRKGRALALALLHEPGRTTLILMTCSHATECKPQHAGGFRCGFAVSPPHTNISTTD